jgi:hypothetical protein
MSRWASLAIVLSACGASSGPGAEPVSPPKPQPPAVTVAPPEHTGDAGLAEPGAAPAPPEPETAPRADSGVTTYSSNDLSPPVRALGAIARHNPFTPGNAARHVVLLRVAPKSEHCAITDSDPDYVMAGCTYKPGACTSAIFTVNKEKATSYKVRIEVLQAPDKKGARGKLRITESDDVNVLGGEIDVLVCD